MKKIILLLLFMVLALVGCNGENREKDLNNFIKKIEKANSYYLTGSMEIINDEDTYLYNIEVSHQKDNYYNATLINQLNNHKQIIIRNDDGVYVVTPSLNKSFKFQSEWPNNSSQAYILESVINDLKNDSEKKIDETDDYIIVTVKANYPNNPKLKTEKIHFDKNMNLLFITIHDESDTKKIEVFFSKIDYKATINKEKFILNSYIEEEVPKTESTGLIDNIVYPLYIPEETYLKDKNVINVEDEERVILTFAGTKNFILVEETVKVSNEFEIIPVYGEPLLLEETYGAISANSINWTRNNIEYYISSNDLTTEEMILIASSLNSNNSISVGK